MRNHERVAQELFAKILKLRLPFELLDLVEVRPETDDAFSIWYVIATTRKRAVHFVFRHDDVTVQTFKLKSVTQSEDFWERQEDMKYRLDKIIPVAIHMIKRLVTKKKT